MRNQSKASRTARLVAATIVVFAFASPAWAQDTSNAPAVGDSIRKDAASQPPAAAPPAAANDESGEDSISVTGGVPGTPPSAPSTNASQAQPAMTAPEAPPAEATIPSPPAGAPVAIAPAPAEAAPAPAPAEAPPAAAPPAVANAPAPAGVSAPDVPITAADVAPAGAPSAVAPIEPLPAAAPAFAAAPPLPVAASAPAPAPEAAPAVASAPAAPPPAPAVAIAPAPAPAAAAPAAETSPVTTAVAVPPGAVAPPMMLTAPPPAEPAPVEALPPASAPAAAAAAPAPPAETAPTISSRQAPMPPAAGNGETKLASNQPQGGAFAGMEFGNSKAPIHIQSKSMSLDYQNHSILWIGNVRATQDQATLTSDQLRVNYLDKDFKQMKDMVADGNVRLSQGKRWATGQHGVMDQTKRTVVLTGSPVAHDGNDQITGCKITVYLNTNQSVVDCARAVIFPHSEQSPAGASPGETAEQ